MELKELAKFYKKLYRGRGAIIPVKFLFDPAKGIGLGLEYPSRIEQVGIYVGYIHCAENIRHGEAMILDARGPAQGNDTIANSLLQVNPHNPYERVFALTQGFVQNYKWSFEGFIAPASLAVIISEDTLSPMFPGIYDPPPLPGGGLGGLGRLGGDN